LIVTGSQQYQQCGALFFKIVMYSKCAKALVKVVEFTLGKQVSPKLSQFFLWIKKKSLLSID
jgi:hypothetical protein